MEELLIWDYYKISESIKGRNKNYNIFKDIPGENQIGGIVPDEPLLLKMKFITVNAYRIGHC